MSWRFANVVAHGRSLLRRLEEARREGDGAQERALRARIAETRRAIDAMVELDQAELDAARELARELEGEEARAA